MSKFKYSQFPSKRPQRPPRNPRPRRTRLLLSAGGLDIYPGDDYQEVVQKASDLGLSLLPDERV